MAAVKILEKLAKKHGTPLFVIDHAVLRKNYATFKKYLPRVQAYYAVKALTNPAVVKTLFDEGASFDVASMPEFMIVHEFIKGMPPKQRQAWIWDKIIYAHPIKTNETLQELDQYQPLVTYDNSEEIKKIKKYAPHAGLALRLKVANTGAMVELSSKFGAAPGEAVNLILEADKAGLVVEGLSFHVGSQCTNIDNYLSALEASAEIFKEVKKRGHKLRLLNIGGGFPVPYDGNVPAFEELAKKLRKEIDRLFPKSITVVAEPGRFLVATAATLVVGVVGKSFRDDKWVYYINDGVYGTLSGVIFDHIPYHFNSFKRGDRKLSAVVGPTCDALDTISTAEMLPELNIGDMLYVRNCGAYTTGSATTFNGFPKTKILNINA